MANVEQDRNVSDYPDLRYQEGKTLNPKYGSGAHGFVAQRLRERQEAAGNGLKSYAGRGGCLLFARRNG